MNGVLFQCVNGSISLMEDDLSCPHSTKNPNSFQTGYSDWPLRYSKVSIKIILLSMLVFINSISDKPWYLMQKLLLRTSNEEQKTLTEKKKPKKWDMDFQRVQRYVSKSSTFKILDYDEEDNDNKCHELRNTQIRRYKPGSIEPRYVSHFTYCLALTGAQGVLLHVCLSVENILLLVSCYVSAIYLSVFFFSIMMFSEPW